MLYLLILFFTHVYVVFSTIIAIFFIGSFFFIEFFINISFKGVVCKYSIYSNLFLKAVWFPIFKKNSYLGVFFDNLTWKY